MKTNRTMPLRSLFLSLPLLLAHTATASIFDFAVVSAGDVRSRECDFQGSLAAGGDVQLQAFALGTELTGADRDDSRLLVGGNFDFTGGTNDYGRSDIGGDINLYSVVQRTDLRAAGWVDFTNVTMGGVLRTVLSNPRLTNSSVPSVVRTPRFSTREEIAELTAEMHRRSEFYRNQKALPPGFQGTGYTYAVVRALPNVNRTVYTIAESTWRAANGLRVIGAEGSVVVVNVLGRRPDMIQKSVVLEGGIRLNTILLNFPEAEEMTITRAGTDQGVPSVLAPNALLHHSNNLITGSVIVREYDGLSVFCGQVNHHGGDRFPDLEEPLPPIRGH